MEILLKFWPLAAALGWLLLIWIGVGFYVCRKYTGTWNGLRYIFDHRYWCFAILNHEYAESLKNNDDIETFIKKFSKRKVMPGKKFGFFKLSEDERKIWVMLLSQKDFVKENFEKLPYTAGNYIEEEQEDQPICERLSFQEAPPLLRREQHLDVRRHQQSGVGIPFLKRVLTPRNTVQNFS